MQRGESCAVFWERLIGVNEPTQVQRVLGFMRGTIFILLNFIFSGIYAQPLFKSLSPDFVLSLYGQRMHGDSLLHREDIIFRADEQLVRPGIVMGTDRAFIRFRTRRSIDEYHKDTLWLEIEYYEHVMRIGFPPRAKDNERYAVHGLWIDFQPGDHLVADLKRVVYLEGTIKNLQEIAPNNPHFNMIAGCNGFNVPAQLDKTSGEISARMLCQPRRVNGNDWIDLELEAHEWYGHLNTTMKIRLPYGHKVELQQFHFVPTSFHRPLDELVIDDEVKRDSIVEGNTAGLEVHLHPVNPKPDDTLSIELRWIGSGAPYVSSHTIQRRKDGNMEIRFSFALRTDVAVATEAWTEQARPFSIPQLPPGRYIITQESITGKDIRDLDLLIGREVPIVVR
ncbi:MAG: hypothetical protein M3R08_07430 [Bacteroidota bacterium]|nr:hypothetical protein [Bacteroidota bacterium]